jgi:hypothetical protein
MSRLRGLYATVTVLAVLVGFVCTFPMVQAQAATSTPTTPTAPFTECPAIGADTSCGLLIWITNSGTFVLGDSSQGPYDGSDDTLIGVLNQSSSPVSSIPLSSEGGDLFGFDGDGICTYATGGTGPAAGYVGDSYCDAAQLAGTDPYDYEGPDNTYSNISADAMSGTVNFTTPLAPGANTYFSLEEALTTTPPDNLQIGGGIARDVALGDSYSSGEGNPPFVPGTDTSSDKCHRSNAAYGPLVATAESVTSSNFVFAACSGAELSDFFLSGQYGEGPQLNAIAPATQPSLTTGLVTLSIGGNDANFVDILGACVSGFLNGGNDGRCNSTITEDLNLGVDHLVAGESFLYNGNTSIYTPCDQRCINSYNRLIATHLKSSLQLITTPGLTGLYEDIHSRAPNAAIRVVLYPHLFPTTPTARCTVGSFLDRAGHTDNYYVSVAEMKALNNTADFLDGAIDAQVLLAQQAGINIQPVDPRSDFENGHELCSNSNMATDSSGSWINPLTFGTFLGSGAAVSSFHPNAVGQADFATLVEASLAGLPLQMDPFPPNNYVFCNAYIGTSFSDQFGATGGIPPYTWTIGSGALPGGVTLSNAGVLSGTPRATDPVGNDVFSVEVTDSGSPDSSVTQSYTLPVLPNEPHLACTG